MVEKTNLFGTSDSGNVIEQFEDTLTAWRSNELKQLQKFDSIAGFSSLLVYGQRQVGKSYLLAEFYKRKPHLYFDIIPLE